MIRNNQRADFNEVMSASLVVTIRYDTIEEFNVD